MPLATVIENYECGRNNDKEGFHLLTCKSGGGPIWSHNCIVSVWCDCLQELNITYRREPRDLYDSTNSCPDIIAFDSRNGNDLELDISLTHPWNADILLRAAEEGGEAAEMREMQKFQKYGKEVDIFGNGSNCMPLVFEHYGRWGEQANKFLHYLSEMSLDERGQRTAWNSSLFGVEHFLLLFSDVTLEF